ncbi:hypothetical protein VNO77_02380 [Canavalia gladiata]|uniref:Uncharacterized protein n=1 Tax=Canavalia gladiata TaxID=3824 RepID=A0AAN9MSX8_CANGL
MGSIWLWCDRVFKLEPESQVLLYLKPVCHEEPNSLWPVLAGMTYDYHNRPQASTTHAYVAKWTPVAKELIKP